MDLQKKLIKSLERTIELQEGLIAEQEAHIQELERKNSRLHGELSLEKLNNKAPVSTPPHYNNPENEWEKLYGPTWTGTFPEVTNTFYPESSVFYTIEEPANEKEKTVQKGSGAKR